MAVLSMEHFTVLTDDLDATLEFYAEVCGMRPGARPPLAIQGAWLYAGGRPILHIVSGVTLPEQRRGVLDHMAFAADDLAGVCATLQRRGVHYDLARLPGYGSWQLFCIDPNGARVELDFAADEAGPAEGPAQA
jgi:catechol 2,3-dioxygenase-like lactoylglutathione lyase family enzyme